MTAGTNADAPWVDKVLGFWFGELSRSHWYAPSEATDQAVGARFGDLYKMLSAAPPDISCASPRTALAAVIVLDQFPRNMFRNSPEAFASDGAALALAEAAIALGLDRKLSALERHCFYLPFQHSENRDAQARACALYIELGDAEGLGFARRHKAIIDRFGRFPHRNTVLGRKSTAEERAFLTEPGSSF